MANRIQTATLLPPSKEIAPAMTLFAGEAPVERPAPVAQEPPSDYKGRAFCRNCVYPLTLDESGSAFIPCTCTPSNSRGESALCRGGCGAILGAAMKGAECATAAVKPCPAPRCPNLVASGRCPDHARPPWARSTPRRRPGGSGWAWARIRRAVLDRDRHRCELCGTPCPHPRCHEVDHVIPVTRGGSDDPANLRVACARCHRAKTAREAREGKGSGSLAPLAHGTAVLPPPAWPRISVAGCGGGSPW